MTLGDHLRRKRQEMKLVQKDVVKILGTNIDTVTYRETNRTSPSLASLPKITEFLGYLPPSILPEEPGKRIAFYRKLMGLSQEKLASRLEVDPGTLGKWEKGRLLSSELDDKISAFFMEALHRFGED